MEQCQLVNPARLGLAEVAETSYRAVSGRTAMSTSPKVTRGMVRRRMVWLRWEQCPAPVLGPVSYVRAIR